MKIKDLPPTQSLGNIRFIYPLDGKTYVWFSQWDKGVWAKLPDDPNSRRIIPLFVDDIAEVLEWDVAKET